MRCEPSNSKAPGTPEVEGDDLAAILSWQMKWNTTVHGLECWEDPSYKAVLHTSPFTLKGRKSAPS